MKKNICVYFSVILSVLLLGCNNTEVFEDVGINSSNDTNVITTDAERSQTTSEDISIETTENGMIIPEEYYEVIESIIDCIDNFDPGGENTYIGNEYGGGVCELCSYDNPYDLIAFSFVDIDGDNVAELAVLSCEDFGYDYRIIDFYAYCDDTVKHIFGGGVRCRYYLTNDMTFYCEGSNGASYSITSRYEYDAENHELSFVDSYYTLAASDVGLGNEGGVLCYTTNELYILSSDTDSPYVEIVETFNVYSDISTEFSMQETSLFDYDEITVLAEYQ